MPEIPAGGRLPEPAARTRPSPSTPFNTSSLASRSQVYAKAVAAIIEEGRDAREGQTSAQQQALAAKDGVIEEEEPLQVGL